MNSTFKFDQSLRDLVSHNLGRHDVVEIDRSGRKHAAVAFTLVDCSQPANIANIPYLDIEHEQAALRELEEEVGLRLDASNVLGRLDDYATRSGFVITPVVVWGGVDLDLEPNPGEVAEIHRIPLAELLREDAPMLDSISESEHPVLKMPLGDEWFAAPSAAIAYQFREVALLGNSTRVVHYEQPYFAWS